MNTHSSPLMIAGAGLATAAAVLAASVTSLGHDLAVAPASSISSPVALLSQSQSLSLGANTDAGGALAGIITNFLDNNQSLVLGLTGGIPLIALGPVSIGNALLASAYYSGYQGSATGVPGVLAYLVGQVGGGSPSDLIKNVVLSLTAQVPTFNLGPVAIGRSVLANAYFGGYNGSPTGVPGLTAYVASQLNLPALAAATPATQAALPAASVAAQLGAATPSDLVKNAVLSLTAQIPTFNIGPVKVGGSVLANAYFNGFDGSPVGLPGLIAYVVSQLRLVTPAASVAPRAASSSARVALPAATASSARVALPAATASSAHVTLPAATASSAHVTLPAATASSARVALPAATALPKAAAAAVGVSVSIPRSVVTAPTSAAAAKAPTATSRASSAPKPAASTQRGR